MQSQITVTVDLSNVTDAIKWMSDALIDASRLTNKEVYILNKLKRAWHAEEVRQRKLRKKHGK